MDKEKEGLIASVPGALTEAAKINFAATKEMASSAVTAFVDTVTGREKPEAERDASPRRKPRRLPSGAKRGVRAA